MKEIFASIAKNKQKFARLPLFQFMADKTIHPKNRLSFAPCAAPFIMSFADLNKYVLRQEPTTDKIQAILNQHTYEDDSHWQWFLEDIDRLGFNSELDLNNSLRFVWSEETKHSRLLAYELYRYLIIQPEPIGRLVILESMEATSDAFSYFALEIAKELKQLYDRELLYFGHCHCDAENGHHAHTEGVRKFLNSIKLEPEILRQQLELVEVVFDLFSQWSDAMLSYAKAYQQFQLYDRTKLLEMA